MLIGTNFCIFQFSQAKGEIFIMAIRVSSWEDLYKVVDVEVLPWFSPDLDEDLDKALAELKITKGHFLDIGTGPATQAIALAKRGFKVTATDISETAIEKGRDRASHERLVIDFKQDDIVSSHLRRKFDLAFDRGCFHVLIPKKRARYRDIVSRLIKPGGYLFLKCFSYKQPGTEGPYRFKPEEIKRTFKSQFDIISIKDTSFKGNRQPNPQALFCVMRKL
jgi:2-polyprenyl-3-methyl-5-hydroxy-6-metoxy-1,4-benzoquinol methylase